MAIGRPAPYTSLLMIFFCGVTLNLIRFTQIGTKLGGLKATIQKEVAAAISQDITQRVMTAFKNCLGVCIENKWHHLTDIVF